MEIFTIWQLDDLGRLLSATALFGIIIGAGELVEASEQVLASESECEQGGQARASVILGGQV